MNRARPLNERSENEEDLFWEREIARVLETGIRNYDRGAEE